MIKPFQTAVGCSVHDHHAIGEAERLREFRRALYGCFTAWPDASFELVDALAGRTSSIRSIAELMFEPVSRRGWGSLYQAMEHGVLDREQLRDVLAAEVAVRRPPEPAGPAMFAIDGSRYPRPHARRVADLGLQHAVGDGSCAPGWMMQWLVQVGGEDALDAPRLSWTWPLDVRRVSTADNANELAAAQIADTVRRLGADAPPPLFLLDAGYCPIYLTQHRPVHAQLLVRLRTDRVFFGRPDQPTAGLAGRPRKHGERFALAEPDTWGAPHAEWAQTRADGVTVELRAWHHLHPRPRQRRRWEGTDLVEGSVARREERHPSGHVRVWWLWWSGPEDAFDPAVIAGAYPHRFTIEHTFRFAKQELFWTGHTPLDPDQAEHWSWLVLAAYAQLHLARPIVADQRLPWEKPCAPAALTPRRVRRAFRAATAHLPTPARAPKPSRPGPGRPPGAKNRRPRTRQPVIKKGRPDNTGHPKGRSPRARKTEP